MHQVPIFSNRSIGQTALARNVGIGSYQGMYTCIIPDENGVNQTLVVGLYRNSPYNDNSQRLSSCSNKVTIYLTLIYTVQM